MLEPVHFQYGFQLLKGPEIQNPAGEEVRAIPLAFVSKDQYGETYIAVPESEFKRLVERASTPGVDRIARLTHEINRAYCKAIGDDSQVAWEQAPEWQRQSAINGVCFHLDNPDASPSASHDNWLAEKERDGWKHGPVKDPEKKEHPCFVPYEALPVEQRAKDYLFKAVVDALR